MLRKHQTWIKTTRKNNNNNLQSGSIRMKKQNNGNSIYKNIQTQQPVQPGNTLCTIIICFYEQKWYRLQLGVLNLIDDKYGLKWNDSIIHMINDMFIYEWLKCIKSVYGRNRLCVSSNEKKKKNEKCNQ